MYAQYLNCRGDASPHRALASPHRDLASPHRNFCVPHRELNAEWSDEKEPVIRNKIAVKTFVCFGLHSISGTKILNFPTKTFYFYFFGVHSLSGTELHNFHRSAFAFQMRLVKVAKAYPHTKFYSLSTVCALMATSYLQARIGVISTISRAQHFFYILYELCAMHMLLLL